MKEINVEELKQIQLELLDNVARFCEANNINYFLAYGTLLGAIRHDGYIPWDDDIDIAMPRPDYIRFVELYNKKECLYRVISHYNEKKYCLPFAKVYHTGTHINEIMYHQESYGVNIDVFPIDGFVNEKQVMEGQRLYRLLNAKKALFNSNRPLFKRIVIELTKLAFSWLSIDKLLDKIDEVCMRGDYEQSTKVGYIPAQNIGMKEIVDKKLISETKYHVFEGKKYRIPIGYDTYLRQLYGNYMQFPPVDKRRSSHVFHAWWI